MEGTIVVREERGTVSKFQNWYKEKFIDTNKSQKFEENFVRIVDFGSKVEETRAKVGAVVVGFIPEVSFLAPLVTSFSKIKTRMLEVGKNTALTAKRYVEAKFIGVDGSSKDVVVPNFNIDDIIKCVEDGSKSVKDIVSEVQNEGKSL